MPFSCSWGDCRIGARDPQVIGSAPEETPLRAKGHPYLLAVSVVLDRAFRCPQHSQTLQHLVGRDQGVCGVASSKARASCKKDEQSPESVL
jgi:hypothetical protein